MKSATQMWPSKDVLSKGWPVCAVSWNCGIWARIARGLGWTQEARNRVKISVARTLVSAVLTLVSRLLPLAGDLSLSCEKRRDESRRGRQECLRHIFVMRRSDRKSVV